MTSVVARAETAVAPDRALHPLPFVVDEAAASPLRSPARRWAQTGLVADLAATALTLVVVLLAGSPSLLALSAGLTLGWPLVLAASGAYASGRGLAGVPAVAPVWRAGSMLGFLALSAAALADVGPSPATLLALTVTVTISSVALRSGTGLVVRRADTGRRIVVAGTYEQVRHVLDELRRDPRHRIEVAAVCLADPAGQDLFDIPVVVGVDRLADLVGDSRADAVIVQPSDRVRPEDLRRLGWQLEARGTAFYLGSGLLDVTPARTSVSRLAGLHLMQVRPAPRLGPGRAVKELWERSAAGLALLLLAPVLGTVALLVRLDSPGPAFFRQPRVGRDGRVFTIWKFRTMTTDAETLAAGLLDDNDCDGVLFKLRRDPRVTRVGRVLRRYSLDELPQLINIASGRMSLVGPRPALPGEVDRYDHDPRRRLVVKPGLTGLWQVSGRSDLSWDESVRLDLLYVDNWSLALDLAIIARTAGAVLRARGAY